jgi:hypothetical protein
MKKFHLLLLKNSNNGYYSYDIKDIEKHNKLNNSNIQCWLTNMTKKAFKDHFSKTVNLLPISEYKPNQ